MHFMRVPPHVAIIDETASRKMHDYSRPAIIAPQRGVTVTLHDADRNAYLTAFFNAAA